MKIRKWAGLGVRVSWVFVVMAGLMLASPSYSAIYKYKDENGKTHFTDSLSKIPPKYRKDGRLKTLKGAPAETSKELQRMVPKERPSTHLVKADLVGGGHYMVKVMINGTIPANLIVDTGATMVVLSEELGQKLGVHRDSTLPTMVANTAGGQVESPLFILDSLRIGSAKVVDLEATTNPHFDDFDGLLGMNWLGEFKMEMDKENSQLILKPLAEASEPVWDGYNGKWWKDKYQDYADKLDELDRLARRVRKSHIQTRWVKKLIGHYTKLHAKLEKRADRVKLPKKYRVSLKS